MPDIAKIDTFIQSSPHPSWLATTQGHCVYANPALERLTGFNSEQINQVDWRSFLLDEDRAVASASWQRSLATGTPYRGQVRLRGGDGGPECVELIAFGHKACDNSELWLFTGIDSKGVAAQKRPELEAQIQATLNVIPAHTWYALPSGALTFVNERTANYLGLPKDHPLRFGIDTGAEWDAHIPLLHPDDQQESRNVWATCLRTGSAAEFSQRVPNAEGVYRWFLSRAEPLRASDGTLLYWIGVNLDIDDAKRAEDALRKSEKELREVVDSIPALIHTARPDGYIDYFNKGWLEYFGVTLDEVAGWNWIAVIHAEDVEGILTRWRACLMTGEIFEYETRVRGANGEYRWMFHRKVPLLDANGNIVKWYGSSMDIHERKTAEEALRSSEAYLAEAQRLSQTGSFGWKPETGEIVWSDETYRIFGYDHAVKPTIDLLVQRVHPEDRPYFLKAIERASAGATQFEHTYRWLLPDGSVKHVHALAHALQDASGNREFVGAATDVTSIKQAEDALRKSEKELRDVIDTIPATVWSALPDGSNIYANRHFVEYSGLSVEQTAGSGWQAVIHPDDLERHVGKWVESVANGKPHENEVRLRRSDGQYRWHLDRGVPLRDEDGNILKWYGVTTDIEDRKRAEEALRSSEAYLAEAQRLSRTGSWAWNPDTDVRYWSEECYRVLGFDPQDGVPRMEELIRRIHPDDQAAFRESTKTAKDNKLDEEVNYRIVHPGGAVRDINSIGHPVFSPSGDLIEYTGTVIDITERKRAEDELRQSEFYLAEAQRLTHTGSWVWQVAGRDALHLSDEWYRIYGFDPKQGMPKWEQRLLRVHPEDRGFWQGTIERAIRERSDYELEFRILLPDGTLKWIHTVGYRILNASGNLDRFVGSSMDVTEHKRAEEALEGLSRDLQESKAKLEEAQRITHVGYWEWDILTGRVNWSDETYRIYGMRPQEHVMDIAACQEKIYPEDWQRGMEEALGSEARFNAECRVIRPTGEVRIAHFQGDVKKDASGQPYHMFGTVQDITDRKRAEEALELMSRDLQESKTRLEEAQRVAHVGHWVWDLENDGVTLSDEAYRIFGLRPQERPMNVGAYQEMVHPEDRGLLLRAVQERLGGGSPGLEYRIVRPSGEVRIVHNEHTSTRDVPGQRRQRFGTVQDITDRKRAEEALQQSQFYLSEGQRLAHTGSWALNPSGSFEYWSQELFKIYGLDPQKRAPTLQEYLAAVHARDHDFMANTIKRMIAERVGCDVKKRIVRPDGEQRYIRFVGIPVVESGVLKGFLGTAMDITEQELLTQELERQQAYLAEAQRLTHTGSWACRFVDREVKMEHLSEEWHRIYGFDPAEGSPTWEELLECIHPEDLPKWKGAVEQAILEKADYDHEFRILLPDGKVKWIHAVGHPVLSCTGDLEQFVGSSTDITERKHAEEALRSSKAYLLEAQSLTHTGSCAIDGTSRETVYWSDEMFRLFGVDPQQGLPTFDQWLQRIHPVDRDKVQLASERIFLSKVDCDVEFRIVKPDGTVKHIHSIGHPVLSATGELVQVTGTMVDVTERKSAEQEREKLRLLEADLAHTNRVTTLGEMAASLAHEIKQPIAAAITSANTCIEWLAHEPPNLDRARAAAARIDKYGNRAAEIIDRIRSFYKKCPPQRELVDVNGIIQEMLTLLKGEADRYSVAIRTELAAELPEIMADRVQLQQVFMNLMVNAIEAMKDSGGELTVKSELQDGQLQFSVSDTGVGLPMEKIDQIFSAFFTTKPQGSGMGLAISRSIVESHGGRLWAASNDRGGARFHFTLPTVAEPVRAASEET